jgi:hypothetical protein
MLPSIGFREGFMKIHKFNLSSSGSKALAIVFCSFISVYSNAHATLLNASSSGTFTMNLDKNALTPYWGYFLAKFWDGSASDYNNPANTGDYFNSQIVNAEIPAVNRVFNLTPVGADPSGQAAQRFVKGTSANFYLNSETLAGVDSLYDANGLRIAGAQIGMTGVQGFYAPNWLTNCCGLGGGLVNGDFSIVYDATRKTDNRSGWYLANNIYFTMATYDFSRLSIAFTDNENWRLSGDLLMSPENGTMLKGPLLTDVGDFCLGVGSYTGCGQVSSVPIPSAIWLFITAITGLAYRLRKSFN